MSKKLRIIKENFNKQVDTNMTRIVRAGLVDPTDLLRLKKALGKDLTNQTKQDRELLKKMLDQMITKSFGDRQATERIRKQLAMEEIEIPKSEMHISRKDMPQVVSTDLHEFLQFMNEHGYSSRRTTATCSRLKPTQNEFNHEKVNQMMKSDKPLRGTVMISKDNYILDGHHRWLAEYNKKKTKVIDVVKLDGNINELLAVAKTFGKTFSKQVHEELNEAGFPANDLPVVLILKRTAIRQYPDKTRVALYYADRLKRMIAIPFGDIMVTEADTSDREEGTTKLAKKYKKETPGQ